MIVETALRIAGPGSHLVHVSRATGVLHVYTGPLTPSGRYAPVAGRTACRAHTRRLRVLEGERPSSLDPTPQPRRLCVRCSARLSSLLEISSSRRAEHPQTRDGYRAAHAATTPADVAFALEAAETLEEVDAAAHLSLVLFDHTGCTQPVTRGGREWPPLHQLVARTRPRFVERSKTDMAFDDLIASGYVRRKAERHQLHHEREARVERLGMRLAKPAPPAKPTSRR